MPKHEQKEIPSGFVAVPARIESAVSGYLQSGAVSLWVAGDRLHIKESSPMTDSEWRRVTDIINNNLPRVVEA